MAQQLLGNRLGRAFWMFVLLGCIPGLIFGQVGTALDNAEAWLLDQQNVDGSLGPVPELVPRDSAVTACRAHSHYP